MKPSSSVRVHLRAHTEDGNGNLDRKSSIVVVALSHGHLTLSLSTFPDRQRRQLSVPLADIIARFPCDRQLITNESLSVMLEHALKQASPAFGVPSRILDPYLPEGIRHVDMHPNSMGFPSIRKAPLYPGSSTFSGQRACSYGSNSNCRIDLTQDSTEQIVYDGGERLYYSQCV